MLVVCNPATQGIGERLRDAAQDAGAEAVLTVMAERELARRGAARARSPRRCSASDVILAPTVQSLSHTAARKAATDAGARAATLPGVTEAMLARVMSADMAELRRRGHALADLLTAGSEARITCPNGSDLRLSLEGRTGIPDAGELSEPGAFGNLPCGEGFISPQERDRRRHGWSSTARSRAIGIPSDDRSRSRSRRGTWSRPAARMASGCSSCSGCTVPTPPESPSSGSGPTSGPS